ncbi:MAG: class I SAM-dependent methyltransferase [Eggerthellaceae bacterium]
MGKDALMQNYYGSLCTEMYELLHAQAPQDELDFYLSYAMPDMKILEPLCGSGRFIVPFINRGLSDIYGMDLSREMIDELRKKCPQARAICSDVLDYAPSIRFDYIFIPSGSISLFTDRDACKKVLAHLKGLLAPGGTLVFAVDTVALRCPDDDDYELNVSVDTEEGLTLVLRTKNSYDESTRTQFSPGKYELYRGEELLQSEFMDFQTHLYTYGEMEELLHEVGFKDVMTYSSYDKAPAVNDECEMFLFECTDH